MNKSQQAAIEKIRSLLNEEITDKAAAEFGRRITRFDIEATDYGWIWVTAQIEDVDLPENNLLRFVDSQHWHIAVGRRGKVTVYQAPRYFRQFAGERAFGVTFHRNLCAS